MGADLGAPDLDAATNVFGASLAQVLPEHAHKWRRVRFRGGSFALSGGTKAGSTCATRPADALAEPLLRVPKTLAPPLANPLDSPGRIRPQTELHPRRGAHLRLGSCYGTISGHEAGRWRNGRRCGLKIRSA